MRSMKIYIISILLILYLNPRLKAQDNGTEKKTPDLTLVVKKLTDGSFELKSRLSLFENRIDIPVAGSKVDFSIGSDSLIRIEGNTTDKNGYAIAYIKPGVKIARSKEGIINATAEFSGDNQYEAATAEVVFTETRIAVSCELVDTIKTVMVEGYKIDASGNETPLSGESVTVSVQRMFSRLPIGDVSLDETGKGSLEFPSDLPGDSLGNLQVVAFIAENETFGNIESSVTVQWGKPKQPLSMIHRALWTQIAPMWMIVSLTFLLIGVWAHYVYVLAQIIKIKIKGKKPILD